jgi:predicted ATPase
LLLQLALGSASIPVTGWAALEVERAFTRARALCERLGDPPELFQTLFGLWTMYFIRAELRAACALGDRLHRRRREARAARETAERLMALSTEHGFIFWLAVANILPGWAMAEQGCNQEAIAQIQEGLAAHRAAGAEVERPENLSLLAEACMKTGRLNDGLSALTEALAAADEHENRSYEAETHRLKGELLLKQHDSNVAEAESCFQRAIEIARNQSAKSWELRATMSLARLLAKQGRRDEARTMLAEIYNWFTEGFDTADLKDGEVLLDELSA